MKRADSKVSSRLPVKYQRAKKFAEMQHSVGRKYFARLVRETPNIATSTMNREIRQWQEVTIRVPNESARDALLEITEGRGLFTEIGGPVTLSERYVSALQKHPVPPEGTSYEDCLDWAKEVRVAASHYVRPEVPKEFWQVQTAKARFSEVFRRARVDGPQRITRQGKDGVIMIAEEQYNRLIGRAHQPTSLVQFFRESPLVGADLDLTRDRAPARDINLA